MNATHAGTTACEKTGVRRPTDRKITSETAPAYGMNRSSAVWSMMAAAIMVTTKAADHRERERAHGIRRRPDPPPEKPDRAPMMSAAIVIVSEFATSSSGVWIGRAISDAAIAPDRSGSQSGQDRIERTRVVRVVIGHCDLFLSRGHLLNAETPGEHSRIRETANTVPLCRDDVEAR